jgi:pimeloyl-ACP methyl ester carboxylesterase
MKRVADFINHSTLSPLEGMASSTSCWWSSLSSIRLATTTSISTSFILCTVFGIWFLVEAIFAVVFFKVLIPKLQQLRPPTEYRDYARDRRQLLNRILQRLEATCHATNSPLLPCLEQYIRQWFHPVDLPSPTSSHPPPPSQANQKTHNENTLQQTASSSSCTTRIRRQETEENDNNNQTGNNADEEKILLWPKKKDMDEFLSWAFFSSSCEDMDDWMVSEMDSMYATLEARYGMTFEPGRATNPTIQPMRVTLDPLEPLYRPFLVYGIFAVFKFVAGLFLQAAGFDYFTTSTGLNYWYRSGRRKWKQRQQEQHLRQAPTASTVPSSTTTTLTSTAATTTWSNSDASGLPLLFLHGIGGFSLYLPMLFFLGQDGRPLFFFENPGISFGLQFWTSPPAERETINGVWEAVHQHLGTISSSDGNSSSTPASPSNNNGKNDIAVSVVGHSFGSCPITWLIHSPYAHYIRQIVLVDPVSILLHEPDVVTNFLYKPKNSPAMTTGSSSAMGKPPTLKKKRSSVGVVSNELFTEHYLRRHFAWYNSELWLEDLPPDVKVLVCLSEQDQLVSAHKVQVELNRVVSARAAATTAASVNVKANLNGSHTLHLPESNGTSSDALSNIEVLVWEGADHAHCLTRPRTWRQMLLVMKRQEKLIFAAHRLSSSFKPLQQRERLQRTYELSPLETKKVV